VASREVPWEGGILPHAGFPPPAPSRLAGIG